MSVDGFFLVSPVCLTVESTVLKLDPSAEGEKKFRGLFVSVFTPGGAMSFLKGLLWSCDKSAWSGREHG